MTAQKLTPKMRKLLEWCADGPRTEVQIIGSGLYDTAAKLRSSDLLALIDHPTVKNRWKDPVRAYEITEAGKAALAELRAGPLC